MSATTDLIPVAHDQTALDADPVGYMAVVLHRAKGWLDEAQSIDEVRHAKALAIGYESVIREKELAFDAQLSATEIVRRCERRIGELVREGQQQGTIYKHGDNTRRDLVGHDQLGQKRTVVEAAGVTEKTQLLPLYTMADARADQFEQAIDQARAEGNLSRANVVRKVKGESPKAERSEWHHKKRHIDADRLLLTVTQEIDAAIAGLDLIDPAQLDPEIAADCEGSIRASVRVINRHLRRFRA